MGLEAGEFGVGLEPEAPGGKEAAGMALAGEHAMQVGALDTESAGGLDDAGIADLLAAALFWNGDHKVCLGALGLLLLSLRATLAQGFAVFAPRCKRKIAVLRIFRSEPNFWLRS